jgi:hypothetical protein
MYQRSGIGDDQPTHRECSGLESPVYVLLNRISGGFDLFDDFDAELVNCLLTRNLVGEIPSNEHVAIQRLDTGFDRPLDDRRFIDIVVFGEFPNVIRNSIGCL